YLLLSSFYVCCSRSSLFSDPPPPQIYSLSLHDALPISAGLQPAPTAVVHPVDHVSLLGAVEAAEKNLIVPVLIGPEEKIRAAARSEEHTSELQSRENLVCRLLLEKKKKKYINASKL